MERRLGAAPEAAISLVFADDDERYRQLLRALLGAYPRFKVIGEASGGREAVELALAHRPQAVLLDIEMPDLDGLEAAKAILALEPAPHIVLHTGAIQDERVARADLLGVEVADKLAVTETLERIATALA